MSLRDIAIARAASARAGGITVGGNGCGGPETTGKVRGRTAGTASSGARGKKRPATTAPHEAPAGRKPGGVRRREGQAAAKAPPAACARGPEPASRETSAARKSGGFRTDPGVYRRGEYLRMSHEARISRAIACMFSMDASIRPRSSSGRPGGLVEFAQNDEREMIVVGDIHANKRNLKAVLADCGNLGKVRRNEAVVIFLGDIVHDERTGHLYDMDSSIEVLDIVIHLINRYPSNIVYLRGNHDTLSPRLSKSGIQQGVLFRTALTERRGARYAQLVWDFLGALPVFVKHRWFLAVHGGPVRGGIGRQELINVAHYTDCEHQLIWNRINETHSTPSAKEYAPEDLDELRRALRCPPDLPVVVGHNPMWKWGGNDSVWVDVLKTHDYVILYSGAREVCPYLAFRGSPEYGIRYANLKLKRKRFVLDND